MVTHVVFFKLKQFTPEGAREVRDRIEAMRGRVPELRHIEAGVDFGRSERAWDVSLVARFDSRADLEAYARHPVHQEFVAWVSGVREAAAVVDYESD